LSSCTVGGFLWRAQLHEWVSELKYQEVRVNYECWLIMFIEFIDIRKWKYSTLLVRCKVTITVKYRSSPYSELRYVAKAYVKLSLLHEGICGSGRIDTLFLDLGTSWRWVVSFKPRPLHPRGKEHPVPIVKEVGWAPEPVWTTWRSANSCPKRDLNSDPLAVQPVASCYTDWAISTTIAKRITKMRCNEHTA
jgi:hypothetical protein